MFVQLDKVKILNDIFAKILPGMKSVKNLLLAFVAVAALVVAASGVISCEQYFLPAIELSQDTVAVNRAQHEVAIVINSNAAWHLDLEKVKAPWVSFSPKSADEGGVLTITISANEWDYDRSVTVPIQTETLERKLYIDQSYTDELPEL